MTENNLENRIELKPLKAIDAEHAFIWTGDAEVTKSLFWDHHPTQAATAEFLKSVAEKHPWFMAICLDGKPVGAVTLDQGQGRSEKRAELGYVLARKYWGQGIASIAAKKAIIKGFAELPIVRIEAFVDPDNRASVRVLEKAGMKKEAYLEKYLIHRGQVRDRLIYAVTKDVF